MLLLPFENYAACICAILSSTVGISFFLPANENQVLKKSKRIQWLCVSWQIVKIGFLPDIVSCSKTFAELMNG